MRKADYAALAAIINDKIEHAKAQESVAASPEQRAQAVAHATCAKRIAILFSERASVDKAAFLKACGIT